MFHKKRDAFRVLFRKANPLANSSRKQHSLLGVLLSFRLAQIVEEQRHYENIGIRQVLERGLQKSANGSIHRRNSRERLDGLQRVLVDGIVMEIFVPHDAVNRVEFRKVLSEQSRLRRLAQ